MQSPDPISFFKEAKRRLLESEKLRFLFFVEERPRHRVIENISIFFLAFLSLGCFLLGLFGFMIWLNYTLLGLLLYYAGILIVLLEIMHFLYDR